jgi:glycosyltransferase involved in cell wall biosynthesis
MCVLSMPDYRRDNPYQTLLAEALAPLGVSVAFPGGYRRGLPITRAVAVERPDLLHLHWPTPYLRNAQGALRAIYCARTLLDIAVVRACGVPMVWTVHNLISHDTPTPRLELAFSRRLVALANALIVHSEGARKEVIARLGAAPERISVVPHGTFRPVYGARVARSEARNRLGVPQEARLALFFGMVRPYKGVTNLLAAWPRVAATRGDAFLLIAGDPRDETYAAKVRAAAEGLTCARLVLQYVPDAEVPLYMGAADVLVLPFEKSFTSGTVALAKGYGVPVVLPEVIGAEDGATAVRARSTGPDDLADAILTALSAPPAAEADERDDWPDVATAHARTFALVVGDPRIAAGLAAP